MDNDELNRRLTTLVDEVDTAHENVRGVLDALAVLRQHVKELTREDPTQLAPEARKEWRSEAMQVLKMSRSLLGDASSVLTDTAHNLTSTTQTSTSIRLADLNPVALEPIDTEG